MCNLFHLLLNPLLTSHRKGLNFGCARKQTRTPGTFPLQLAVSSGRRFCIQSSPSMFRLSASSMGGRGVREPHTPPSTQVHPQSKPFPLAMVLACHNCKSSSDESQRPGSPGAGRVSHNTIFTNSPEQYISTIHGFTGLTKSAPAGDQVL